MKGRDNCRIDNATVRETFGESMWSNKESTGAEHEPWKHAIEFEGSSKFVSSLKEVWTRIQKESLAFIAEDKDHKPSNEVTRAGFSKKGKVMTELVTNRLNRLTDKAR